MDRAEAAALTINIVQNIKPGESTKKAMGGMVDAGATNMLEGSRATLTDDGDYRVGSTNTVEEIAVSADTEERQEERAGAVERHRRVRRIRHGVPDWARPSQEELENIVRRQVRIMCFCCICKEPQVGGPPRTRSCYSQVLRIQCWYSTSFLFTSNPGCSITSKRETGSK